MPTGQDYSINQVAAPPLGSLPWESPQHLGLRGLNGNSAAPSPNLLPDPYSLVPEMAPAATQWQEEGIWAPARLLSPLVPPPVQIKQNSPSPAGSSPCLPILVTVPTHLLKCPFHSTSNPSAHLALSFQMYPKAFHVPSSAQPTVLIQATLALPGPLQQLLNKPPSLPSCNSSPHPH